MNLSRIHKYLVRNRTGEVNSRLTEKTYLFTITVEERESNGTKAECHRDCITGTYK